MPRQTTFQKTGEFTPAWRHISAQDQILGRLATRIAMVLMGKHRPEYTPHIDTGDYVIVTNAAGITMTGRKFDHRTKQRYTGYPGGLNVKTYRQIHETHPERLIEDAVRRMLPKGRLGRQMIQKLKVYAGAEHPHQAQQPVPLD